MASSKPKPENSFIRHVHSRFTPGSEPYHVKMSNPYTAGIPDLYYSGDKGDLWVEYKFEPIYLIPGMNYKRRVAPDVTKRQAMWLISRHKEGRRCLIVLGTPNGAAVFTPEELDRTFTIDELLARMMTVDDLAHFIEEEVGVGYLPPTHDELLMLQEEDEEE